MSRERGPETVRRLSGPAVALAAFLAAGGARAADCQVTYTPMNVCKRCTTVLNGSTSRDTACSGYAPSQLTNRVLLDSKVVKQPRNGRATVNGPTWTYAPKAGFTGKDVFTLERNALQGEQLYVFYLEINIDVRP